jgi:hypothetical protein
MRNKPKSPLLDELDRLDLNRKRDDQVEEDERISAKKNHSDQYALAHPDDYAALRDAFDRYISADASAVMHTTIGAKVIQGGKEGHAAAHGTEEEKAQKRGEYQTEVDRLHELKPNLSYEELCKRAAKRFCVHKETIKRNTKNPRKK